MKISIHKYIWERTTFDLSKGSKLQMTESWKCVEWQNGKDDAFGDKRPLASGQLHTFFETTCNPYFLFLFYRTAAPHIGRRDQRDSQWIAMASTIQPRPEPNRVMGLTRHCYKTKYLTSEQKGSRRKLWFDISKWRKTCKFLCGTFHQFRSYSNPSGFYHLPFTFSSVYYHLDLKGIFILRHFPEVNAFINVPVIWKWV